MSVAGISDGGNPAANRRRMWTALGALAVLAVLAWVTIDGNAMMPVQEHTLWGMKFGGFGVQIRLIPELVLGLFAVRVVTANVRARLESEDR